MADLMSPRTAVLPLESCTWVRDLFLDVTFHINRNQLKLGTIFKVLRTIRKPVKSLLALCLVQLRGHQSGSSVEVLHKPGSFVRNHKEVPVHGLVALCPVELRGRHSAS